MGPRASKMSPRASRMSPRASKIIENHCKLLVFCTLVFNISWQKVLNKLENINVKMQIRKEMALPAKIAGSDFRRKLYLVQERRGTR